MNESDSKRRTVDIDEIKEQSHGVLMKYLNDNSEIADVILEEDSEDNKLIYNQLLKTLVKRTIDYILRNKEHLNEIDKDQNALSEFSGKNFKIPASINEIWRVQKDQVINTTRDLYELTIMEQRTLAHKTGLLNKLGHEQRLIEEISLSTRERLPFSMLLFDIDKFKAVNTEYGHSGGDIIIQEVADRLKDVVRDTDHASCWGGDEYAVILHNTDTEKAKIVAVRIAQAINEVPFNVPKTDEFPGGDVQVTVSIGGSQFTTRKEDPLGESLFESTDYQASILKGDKPDNNNIIDNRRGGICFEKSVMSKKEYNKIVHDIEMRSDIPRPTF